MDLSRLASPATWCWIKPLSGGNDWLCESSSIPCAAPPPDVRHGCDYSGGAADWGAIGLGFVAPPPDGRQVSDFLEGPAGWWVALL